MSRNSTPSYYAIITADVRYSDKISSSEKLFFAEITALTNKTGECFASNKYFSKLYNVDPSTISKWVSKLKKQGFINVRYVKEGEQIKERFISINRGIENNQYPIEYNHQGIEKRPTTLLKKSQGGIEKTPKSNTTSSNNTRKTTTIPSPPKITPEMEQVIKAWNRTFEIVVDKSDDKLLDAISVATQDFGISNLLQAIKYRSQAKFYKEDYPHLRDDPKYFFCYPKTIKNDMNRRPFKLITYDKKCQLEQNGTDKKFEKSATEKDNLERPKWRMYD